MGNVQSNVRNNGFQALGHSFNTVDAVVDKEYLPAPLKLSGNGILDDTVCKFGYIRHHGMPVFRWCFNKIDIPNANQGHVQRSGYGCRRKGQHINGRTDFFQGLLVSHTESVLFIDNEQPEIFEGNIFLE